MLSMELRKIASSIVLSEKIGAGDRVQISDLSGISSGKTGVVVPERKVKFNDRRVPILEGEYKPWDTLRRLKERFVQLDDGSIIAMFVDRLHKI
jgi:hypothetical protein